MQGSQFTTATILNKTRMILLMIMDITFDNDDAATVVDDNPATQSIIATWCQLCSVQHCNQEQQCIKPFTTPGPYLIQYNK